METDASLERPGFGINESSMRTSTIVYSACAHYNPSRHPFPDFGLPPLPQPCDIMGVNKRVPVVKQMFDDGDAAFVANIGPLVEPVTKSE